MSIIQDQLNDLRKELLDITLRNRMLKLRETSARGLTIVDTSALEVVQNLRESSKKHFFLDKESAPAAKTRLYLKTNYTKHELEKRLSGTLKEAKSFIEEQGINTLFLTIGAIEWYASDSSETPILSPLLFMPVSLVKKADKGLTEYELGSEEPDLQTNYTLQVKMKEHELYIPNFEENNVSDYFKIIEEAIINKKRWRILPNEMRINLFAFQKLMMYHDLGNEKWLAADNYFIKELLDKDGDFINNDSEKHSYDGDNDADFSFDTLPISGIDHVLDADSSQGKAIERVFRNRALVIQGPPGTGKSQTIVNIIASCIKRGKTVLFVAEKLAALEVVRARLDKVGLGATCLELHSHKANVKTVLKTIDETLAYKSKQNVPDYHRNLQKLDEERSQLNEYYAVMMSEIGKSGINPFTAMGEILSIKQRLPDVSSLGGINTMWTKDDIQDRYEAITKVCRFVKENGLTRDSPFSGAQIISVTALEKDSLKGSLSEIKGLFVQIIDKAEELATKLKINKPQNIADIKLLLATAELLLENPKMTGICTDIPLNIEGKARMLFDLGAKFHDLKTSYKDKILPEAHHDNFHHVKIIYETKGQSWFGRNVFNAKFKAAKTQLLNALKIQPNTIEEAIELAEVLIAKKNYITDAAQLNTIPKDIFSDYTVWHFENDADWLGKKDAVEYVFKIKKAENTNSVHQNTIAKMTIDTDTFKTVTGELSVFLPDFEQKLSVFFEKLEFEHPAKHKFYNYEKSITGLRERIETLHSRFDELNVYCNWNEHQQRLIRLGCGFIFDKLLNVETSKIDEIVDYYKYALSYAFYDAAEKENPILKRTDIAEIASDFCMNDKYLIEQYNTMKIKHLHLNALPNRDAPGEPMSVLRKEMSKRMKHLSLQKLMKQTGEVLVKIKPVFMMSPLSVAQYLQTENLSFDYVIFDEASQVKPVDSFGALLRGRNVIVVGDSKQLPPSNFFGKTDSDEIENDDDDIDTTASDMESILDVFVAKNARETMLKWHYRSKHESLIAVSNHEFYERKLITLPSAAPQSKVMGLLFKHLPETNYSAGKNEMEAKYVIDALLEHFENTPEKSIGIVAFGTKQRNCIEDLLHKECKKNAKFAELIAQAEIGNEPFFIKNLENVQGDERDVIFVSICYGKTPDGKLAQRFGPINQNGGERRLNVLFTRAKEKCVLFSNFKAEDLRLGESDKAGLRVFKGFLDFAENRRLSVITQTGRKTDSPFEDAVKAALESEGFTVDIQIGSAGYFIDLAVPHPTKKGNYLLGIECDGATYHSSKSARDRDRLRQGVLEGLGWHIYRVWSTDWFRNPKKETEKLVAHIRSLENGVDKKKEGTVSHPPIVLEDKKDGTVAWIQPYRTANVDVSGLKRELVDEDKHKIVHIVHAFLEIEAPVHQDYLKKIITKQLGIAKIGNRVATKFDDVFNEGVMLTFWEMRNSFLWLPKQRLEKARDRSALDEELRVIEWIAPEEIQIALRHIATQALRITKEELMKEALKTLNGGVRLTVGIQSVIETELDNLLSAKSVKIENDMVVACL